MNLAHPESLLFWNTLIFLILLFLLAKYAWKPIMNAVKQREGEKLIKQAQQAIDSEKKVALAQLKDQVAALSVEMAQKVMMSELSDEKKQTALINDYLKGVTLN